MVSEKPNAKRRGAVSASRNDVDRFWYSLNDDREPHVDGCVQRQIYTRDFMVVKELIDAMVLELFSMEGKSRTRLQASSSDRSRLRNRWTLSYLNMRRSHRRWSWWTAQKHQRLWHFLCPPCVRKGSYFVWSSPESEMSQRRRECKTKKRCSASLKNRKVTW